MPTQNDIELRSEEVQDILEKVPHWLIRWGNIVVLALLLLVLMVSWLIRYPDIITTEISITTQIPPEKLISKTSGRIEKILVADRASVTARTPLAIIESTANYQDVFLLKATMDTIKTNEKEFVFPVDKLPLLQLGNIDGAYAVFEKDYLAYRQNKELEPYQIERASQGFETLELQERLNLLLQQQEIGEREIVLKKKELDRYQKLHEKGIIATQEWETKSLDFLQQERNNRNLNSQISQLKSSLNDLNRSKRTTILNETKDEVILLRNTLQSYNLLKKAVADWEMEYVLQSAISGEVSFLQIWTESQTITAGDNVFAVIPENTHNYIGKVKAKAQNSGKLKVGQAVNIRLANYPDREFGIVRGKIKSISLTPDKEGDLLIDVILPYGLTTSYKKEIAFQQEMSGTADIITEDLRLIERLLYQFRDIFRR